MSLAIMPRNKALVTYKTTRRVNFEALLDSIPDQGDLRATVYQLQIDAGYHPLGYDGPFQVSTEVKPQGYLVTWHCAGSSD